MSVLKQKGSNLILIGMPGAGKSTVGVVLAKNMGLRFLDSDICIQEQEGKLLHEIIAQSGLNVFMETENRINASLQTEKSVIATGGSVVYGKEAMEHFKDMGTVIYLKLPYDEIKERLGDLTKRGVVLKPGQTLKDLYEERIPLYEKYADITINCTGKAIREIVSEIGKNCENMHKGRI